MAVTCPVCGNEVQDSGQIMNHMKSMTDDAHKAALKQKMGEKGGEATDKAKEKADDMASGIKDKVS